MAKVERIEPTQLPNGLWLDGNEYASENGEESSGVLSLVAGETDGYRVGPELDLSAISDVTNSKLEWTSSGDAEVLAAVSEVSANGSIRGDGVDDYINYHTLGNTGSDIVTKGIEITFWVKNFTTDKAALFGSSSRKSGDETQDSAFYLDINNALDNIRLVYRGTDSFVNITTITNTSINDDEWHFIKVTITPGASNMTLELHFDDLSDTSTYPLESKDFVNDFLILAHENRGSIENYSNCVMSYFKMSNADGIIVNSPLDDPPGSTTARDISGNNNDGTIVGASYSPDNPLLQAATNGQAIPGVTPGADLAGKKLYTQQRFSRDTTGDPSPTLTELKATVEGAGGALPLINGGLIRSAHTQSNTMIR